jgi:hypothetical protein
VIGDDSMAMAEGEVVGGDGVEIGVNDPVATATFSPMEKAVKFARRIMTMSVGVHANTRWNSHTKEECTQLRKSSSRVRSKEATTLPAPSSSRRTHLQSQEAASLETLALPSSRSRAPSSEPYHSPRRLPSPT